MTDERPPCHVHLVGSIGLDSVDEVFRTVGPKLGRRLKRIPDGEQGPRRLWVSFQYPFLRSSPFLRPDPSGALRKTSGFPLLCLAEGVSAADLRFGELGYAREARASYSDFVAARGRGLDTCPQAAFTQFHRIIADQLQLPPNEMVVCGMSLGYADPDRVENSLVTERESVSAFARFID